MSRKRALIIAILFLFTFNYMLAFGASPVVTTTPVTNANEDSFYSYKIEASDTDNDEMTWTAPSIPGWLSLSKGTTSTVDFGDAISGPGAVAIDSSDNIYVAQLSSANIYKITPDGTQTIFASVATSSKYGMLVIGTDLYISYYNLNKITKLDLNNPGAGETDYINPITDPLSMVLKDGFIYVAQYSPNKISKINLLNDSVTDHVTGTPYPFGLGFASNGDLYIASYNNKYISKYASNVLTANIKTFTVSLSDVKIDKFDNIYVSTYGSGVKKVSSDLATTTDISVTGRVWGMSLSDSGTLIWGINDQNKAVKLETGVILIGTPTNDDVGVHNINLNVSDGVNDVPHNFQITVSNTNDNPTITGTPDTTIAEDVTYSFIPTGNDIDEGENGTLTYGITNKPSWASFNASTGALTGTPDDADIGITNGIVISVTDVNAASASLASFNLEVTSVNDTPTLSGTPATTITENSTYSFTPIGNDEDNGETATLTYSIANAPHWASFNTLTGELAGLPTTSDIGNYNGIVISVTDVNNAISSLPSFNIQVTSKVTAPTIATTEVTSILGNSAVVGCEIADNGGGSLTERGICWSVDPGPTRSDNCIVETVSGSGLGILTTTMSGLHTSTVYYVRAFGTNNAGTFYGTEHMFKTEMFFYLRCIPEIMQRAGR